MLFSRRFTAIFFILLLDPSGFVAASSSDDFHGTFTHHPFDEALKKNFEFEYVGTVVEARPACGVIHLSLTSWLNGSIASHVIEPILARFKTNPKLLEVTKRNTKEQVTAHLKAQEETWKHYRTNIIKNSEEREGLQLVPEVITVVAVAAAAYYGILELKKFIFGDDMAESYAKVHEHVETSLAKSLVASALLSLKMELSSILSSLSSSRPLDQKLAEFLGGNTAVDAIFERFINEYDTSSIKMMGSDGYSLVAIQATGATDDIVYLEMCVPSSLDSEGIELVNIVPKGVFDGGEYVVPLLPSSLYAVQTGTERLEDLLVVEETELVKSTKIGVVQRFYPQEAGCSLGNVGGCPTRRYSVSPSFVHITPLGNRKFLVATTVIHGQCERGKPFPITKKLFIFDEKNGCRLKLDNFHLGKVDMKGNVVSPGVDFVEDTIKEESNLPEDYPQYVYSTHMSITAVAVIISIVVLALTCYFYRLWR